MGKSQETFHKKEVRNKKEKKKKAKAEKREARKDQDKSGNFDDMIAYVDSNGNITSTPPDPDTKQEVNAEEINIYTPKRSDDEDMETTRTGKVKFFNNAKGYGFITDANSGDSVFVHVNDLDDEIEANDKVTFEIYSGKKGPAAKEVKILEE